MKPVTLISGASAGIGAELARVFAAHGHELVLVARRADRLAALAEEIAVSGRPRPAVLTADLERRDAVAGIIAELKSLGLEPANVVNNAGFGLIGPASALDRDQQLAMIDLNVRALTELSLAFVDSLERHRGGILNVASLAAFLPGPGMAVYYASKAYVLSFSEALHQELAGRGVRVTALCPVCWPSAIPGAMTRKNPASIPACRRKCPAACAFRRSAAPAHAALIIRSRFPSSASAVRLAMTTRRCSRQVRFPMRGHGSGRSFSPSRCRHRSARSRPHPTGRLTADHHPTIQNRTAPRNTGRRLTRRSRNRARILTGSRNMPRRSPGHRLMAPPNTARHKARRHKPAGRYRCHRRG